YDIPVFRVSKAKRRIIIIIRIIIKDYMGNPPYYSLISNEETYVISIAFRVVNFPLKRGCITS
ncbi:MAG: hypothetical protein PVH77_07370, partial [Phycisphaerales bacterium]